MKIYLISISICILINFLYSLEFNGYSRRILRSIAAKLKTTKDLNTINYTTENDTALLNIQESLNSHELLCLRLNDIDKKSEGKVIGMNLAKLTNSELIQTLGHTILLYRESKPPNNKITIMLKEQLQNDVTVSK